mgnify:CR=1 FL=1
MTLRTASTLTRFSEPTAMSMTSLWPVRPYLPESIADELIFSPSSEGTSLTTESSSGFTPRSTRASLTALPDSRVSSDTTRTSARSMAVAGP